MTDSIASAPGKVVIAGEYAVLHGAPAISMAVGCRAKSRIVTRDFGESVLTTVGFEEGSRPFRIRDKRPVWPENDDARGNTALFDSVFEEIVLDSDAPISVTIDSSEFAESSTGKKYGFGSSAAVAVSLTAACLGPGAETSAIIETAGRAHRRFQGGSGSGIDIASAALGGVIQFQRDGEIVPLAWPDGLFATVLWSGRPASTRAKIEGIERDRPTNAAVQLGEAAREVCSAWTGGEAADTLAALQAFVLNLRAYDERERRGIFVAGHAELLQLAKHTERLVYKPCGAGGGDIGMAFCDSPGPLDAFSRQATDYGFTNLDAGLERDGVRFEGQAA